ncbi:Pilus assembly protein PilY OS=Stutzerimonas stutzeri OX=316 GN=UF78_03755 PE=4 SV=1 [Stutzerimonas stutzeri]
MHTMHFSKIITIFTVLLAGQAIAGGFEGNGEIAKVELLKNQIEVDEQTYSLPHSTQLDGSPAIFQLKPGCQIGFSGRLASPHNIIDSVYLYPESVKAVEQGRWQRPDRQEQQP